MKKDYIQIAIVFDRSGSMQPLWNDSIGGLYDFIQQQKTQLAGKKVNITIVMFNDDYELIYDGQDLFTSTFDYINKFKAQGTTSLYDAIGKLTTDIGIRLDGMLEQDKPQKVIIAIMTDGEQNTSRLYDVDTIKTIIQLQQNKYNWTYVYLSSDLNAVQDANNMGFKGHHTILYNATASGHRGVDSRYAQFAQKIKQTVDND